MQAGIKPDIIAAPSLKWCCTRCSWHTAAPTQQAYDVFYDLSARIDRHLERWRDALATDVAACNRLMRDTAIPAIVPQTSA